MARAREEERAREEAEQSDQMGQSPIEKKMIDTDNVDFENDLDNLGANEEGDPKAHYLRNSRTPRTPVSRLGRGFGQALDLENW